MLESYASDAACSVSSCASPSSGLHVAVGDSEEEAPGKDDALQGPVTGGGDENPLAALTTGSLELEETIVTLLVPPTL